MVLFQPSWFVGFYFSLYFDLLGYWACCLFTIFRDCYFLVILMYIFSSTLILFWRLIWVYRDSSQQWVKRPLYIFFFSSWISCVSPSYCALRYLDLGFVRKIWIWDNDQTDHGKSDSFIYLSVEAPIKL